MQQAILFFFWAWLFNGMGNALEYARVAMDLGAIEKMHQTFETTAHLTINELSIDVTITAEFFFFTPQL
ncbi:hypothetical protein [Deefgea sp. CFH1-16]|uniref:hypothetical protein n=1 Tax=Deefgea sp. CFH1-16 TaxID=2675457 RepID=UPI0015F6ABB1|nr:hypothetical protein [Deefgea sp. CFH1-16]MBM5573192.1 hypothetical protein [Deefgea sp. CFH1-16]